MSLDIVKYPVLAYTGPGNRGKCGFCGKTEGGYAKQDANGKWQASCWECVKPKPLPPQKRNPVGSLLQTEPEEDKDL